MSNDLLVRHCVAEGTRSSRRPRVTAAKEQSYLERLELGVILGSVNMNSSGSVCSRLSRVTFANSDDEVDAAEAT